MPDGFSQDLAYPILTTVHSEFAKSQMETPQASMAGSKICSGKHLRLGTDPFGSFRSLRDQETKCGKSQFTKRFSF